MRSFIGASESSDQLLGIYKTICLQGCAVPTLMHRPSIGLCISSLNSIEMIAQQVTKCLVEF